jgi:hypothetical protein
MGLNKDSQFYKKAVQYIEEFLATGKKIEEMSTKDKACSNLNRIISF